MPTGNVWDYYNWRNIANGLLNLIFFVRNVINIFNDFICSESRYSIGLLYQMNFSMRRI